MEWMKERNMQFSLRDNAIFLDLVAKTRGIATAEDYFINLQPRAKNQFTYGALLNCYCRELMVDKALEIFNEMDKRGFLSCALPFDNLMALNIRLGCAEMVDTLAGDMRRRSVRLSTFTYNMLLQSYGCLNDLKSVERVIEELKEKEEKCDWTTYTNIATVYIKFGLLEKAEKSLKRVEQEMDPRDREAYHFLIGLYARTSNLHEVKRVWHVLKSKFETTTNSSYVAMLQALTTLKDTSGILECFEEWDSTCLTYDLRVVNIGIKAYLDKGMCEEAVSIFHKSQRSNRGPFFKIRETFILFFLKNRKLELALHHLRKIILESKGRNWQPRREIVLAFFELFCSCKDVEGAERFCNILKCYGSLDSDAYMWLMKTYAEAGRSAPEMRNRMETDNVEIGEVHASLLHKICPKKVSPEL